MNNHNIAAECKDFHTRPKMTCQRHLNPTKKHGGFTYVEILIAFALFSILLMTVILMLGQAGRNMAFAQEGHSTHLAAQSLMLVVREALEDASASDAINPSTSSAILATVIEEYAFRRGIENYSIWIMGGAEFHSPNAPEANITFTGSAGINISGHATMIITIVWNEYGYIAGRAIGVVNS